MPKRRAHPPGVAEKMYENRVRERASRWGLRLTRSRQRDGAVAGSYGLVDDTSGTWAFAGELGYGKTLEACEAYLRQVVAEHANGATAV